MTAKPSHAEPAIARPGVANVRSLLLLLADHGLVSRGTVVSADFETAQTLLDKSGARPVTNPDLVTWGRDPVEI